MAYSIKKHEVDRLVGLVLVLGWVLEQELPDDSGVTVVLRRDIPESLLRASGEISKKSGSS